MLLYYSLKEVIYVLRTSDILDEKEKMMFTGDNTNFCLWMHLPGCTTLEEWLQSAKTILDYYDMGYKAYGGHSKGLQSKEETKRVYNCVKKVVEKNTIKANKIIDNQLIVANTQLHHHSTVFAQPALALHEI